MAIRALVAALSLLLILTVWAAAQPLKGCPRPADGVRRAALVVGNGKYPQEPLQPITENDADRVAAAFCKDGFSYVNLLKDGTRDKIDAALGDLSNDVTAHPDTRVSVFYYSGHGIEIAGENYIVPVDAPFTNDQDMTHSSVGVTRDVLPDLGTPGKLSRIVILDACRDNRLSQAGLSPTVPADPDQFNNLLVAFAGAPGQTVSGAIDGDSLFTWELLPLLTNGNLSILKVHMQAASNVADWTGTHQPQSLLYPQVNLYAYRSNPFYTEPASGTFKSEAIPSSIVVNSNRAIYAESTAKGVTPLACTDQSCPGKNETIGQLLKHAQDALSRTMKDKSGAVRRDEFGNPVYAPNFAKAASYWQAAANRGSVSALRRLGDLYKSGRGVGKSLKKAFSDTKAAADKGDAIAIDHLADFYRDGDVVPKDYAKAIALYNEARKRGFASATGDLAFMHYEGWGFPDGADYKKALRLFKEADDDGAPDDASWIGWMYLSGHGVKFTLANVRASIPWLQLATANGDVVGMEYLSRLYEQGYPIAKDIKKSNAYYAKALSLVDKWYIKKYELDQDQ